MIFTKGIMILHKHLTDPLFSAQYATQLSYYDVEFSPRSQKRSSLENNRSCINNNIIKKKKNASTKCNNKQCTWDLSCGNNDGIKVLSIWVSTKI